jgi:hypothetical protein
MIPCIIIGIGLFSLFGCLIDRYLIIKLFIFYELFLFNLFGAFILGIADILSGGIILVILFLSSLELVLGLAVLLV